MTDSIATKSFCGIKIAATTCEDAVSLVIDSALSEVAQSFRFVNAGTIDAAQSDPSYMKLLMATGVNFPDGQPLAREMARTSPRDVTVQQVRGPSLFASCLDEGRVMGIRHFFLGSSPKTLDRLRDRVLKSYPGIEVSGDFSPPFADSTVDTRRVQDELIAASGANLVWVALGTPKQDREALRLTQTLGITTAAVGAAFDFLAGTKAEAPPIIRKAGLEWLHRLIHEPRRLGRRYLIGNFRFLQLVARHRREADSAR